jgi:hypothetical protein
MGNSKVLQNSSIFFMDISCAFLCIIQLSWPSIDAVFYHWVKVAQSQRQWIGKVAVDGCVMRVERGGRFFGIELVGVGVLWMFVVLFGREVVLLEEE